MISLKLKKDHKQGLIKKLQLRASALPNRTDIIKLATFSAISVAMVIKTATAWNTALDLSVFIPMLFLLDCFLSIVYLMMFLCSIGLASTIYLSLQCDSTWLTLGTNSTRPWWVFCATRFNSTACVFQHSKLSSVGSKSN